MSSKVTKSENNENIKKVSVVASIVELDVSEISKKTKPPDNKKKPVKKTKTGTKRNDNRRSNYVRKNLSSIKKSDLRIPEIKLLTIQRMKELGVYHESYDDVIHIYSNMIYEYERCLEQFSRDGNEYEVDTGAGSTKKSGIVSAMEILRKDIGTYSDRLQLNPKSSGKVASDPEDKMTAFLNSQIPS